MTDEIRLTLPIPPSANRLHVRVGRGKRARSPVYQTWLNNAGWRLSGGLAGTKSKVKGPYTLDIAVPKKLRGDVDNRAKPVADLLVSHGVTPDDRHMQSVSVRRDAALTDSITVVVRAA